MLPTITTFQWVPPFARGQVRDIRVRWALEETGIAYQVALIADAKTPDHRRSQPFGQVPTYRDDTVALFESGAIVLHVARQAPGLLPDDPVARARVEQWVIAALNSVEPCVMELARADVFEADQLWTAARRPTVVAAVRTRLQDLAATLGDSAFLEGDFSAADLIMACVLRIVPREEILDDYPTLAAYLDRCTERPAFCKALADQLALYGPTEVAA